jgi:DNA-binding CsgD family transcriptional regulator
MSQVIDVSTDLLIKPHLNGLQLLHGEDCAHSDLHRLSHLYDSPMSVYVMGRDSRGVSSNECAVQLNSGGSLDDLIGRSAHEFWEKEAAANMIASDQFVINSQNLHITDDSCDRLYDDKHIPMITFKMPLYQEADVVAVFGFTLQIDVNNLTNLAAQLAIIADIGLIQPGQLNKLRPTNDECKNLQYYTKRELEVLSYVVYGYPAREIALRMKISKRTVEHHIENIKTKANCKNKYELINKFYWKIKR